MGSAFTAFTSASAITGDNPEIWAEAQLGLFCLYYVFSWVFCTTEGLAWAGRRTLLFLICRAISYTMHDLTMLAELNL